MKRFLIALFAIIAIISFSHPASARQPERGYRGFIDWSNSLRRDKMFLGPGKYTTYYTGFSTSHGAQLNRWLYIGGGFDYEYWKNNNAHILAPFINGRTDLLFGKFTPFGDIRLGYNLTDGGGIYFSPTIGYRFNWGRKMGINLGVGATIIQSTYKYYHAIQDPDGYWIITDKVTRYYNTTAFFSFRIGIDF